MHDNLPLLLPVFSPLPDHAVITLEGAEAALFAHSQFASDVTALAAGHWQWSALLTPKGRVIAVFALLRSGTDTLHLLLPDMPAAAFATMLQRFVFRRKVKISVRDDLRVLGALAPPARAQGSTLAQDDSGQIELDMGGTQLPRSLRIAPFAAAQSAVDDDAVARWKATDLRLGLPRLPDAQREQWTPQQLSLDRLRAYSVKKGCYPGQEIVARTHFLGNAKRGLALLEAPSDCVTGAEVNGGEANQPNTVLGSVVCVAAGRPTLALAVLPLEYSAESLTIGGHAMHVLPLQDGLAR